MTSYPYTKESVNIDRLTAEIEADETIVTDLLGVSWTSPDVLSIDFDGELTQDEETALDTVVSAHDGTPLPEHNSFCCRCANRFTTMALTPPTTCPYCDCDNIISNPLEECDGICAKALEHMRGFSMSRTLPPTENYTVELGNFVKGSGSHTLLIGATVCSANFAVSKIFLVAVGYNETGGNWREVIGVKSSGEFAENDFALDVSVIQNTCYLRLRRGGGAQSGTVAVKIVDIGFGDATWTETSETGTDTPPTYYQGTLMEARDGIVYVFGNIDMQNRSINNVSNLQSTSEKDQANGYAGLGADSKINSAQLPAIAIVDIFTAANETEQLALTVQKGDVCVRTDESKTYINKTGNNTSMDDWEYLQSPTDAVQSVDGRTGVVTLDDLYEAVFSKNTAFNKDFGSGAGTVCEGDDSRLTATKYAPMLILVYRTTGVIFPNNDDGFCHIGGAGAITATEAYAQLRMPKGKLIGIQGYAAGGDGSFTVRKNGADTGITGTIDSVGQFRFTGDAVDFAEGGLLSLAYSSGVNLTVYGIQIEFNMEVE